MQETKKVFINTYNNEITVVKTIILIMLLFF